LALNGSVLKNGTIYIIDEKTPSVSWNDFSIDKKIISCYYGYKPLQMDKI
jgi:hypothetical protein